MSTRENESAGELAERQQKLGFMMSRLRKACFQPASAAYIAMSLFSAMVALTAAKSAGSAVKKYLHTDSG